MTFSATTTEQTRGADASTEQYDARSFSHVMPTDTWRTLSYQKRQKLPTGADAYWNQLLGKASDFFPRRRLFLTRASKIIQLESSMAQLSTESFQNELTICQEKVRRGKMKTQDLIRAFALIREASHRSLGMRHHRVQLAAAMAMYNGCIIEFATGEGKTLTATIPAALAGWLGRGCHVITVNDYLAERDADIMRPLYEMLGLRVDSVVGDASPPSRREAYAADITYSTNKQVCADYVRDSMALRGRSRLTETLTRQLMNQSSGQPQGIVMRGLAYAIIDEADSVLIDDGVTPLIMSAPSENEAQLQAYRQAAEIAKTMASPHFTRNDRYQEIRLTTKGENHLLEMTKDWGGLWRGFRRAEELVTQALTAREFYLNEKQYVIQNGKVVIIDQSTGRLMPDREWRDGLHQAVSAKEGLDIEAPKETNARISFQRFFRKYRHLCGMTGTAWEGRGEFWQVYRCPTVPIPTNKRSRRKYATTRITGNTEAKYQKIINTIHKIHQTGQPILVGTHSVLTSRVISDRLKETELPHQVLNAVNHAEEAEIVKEAGQRGMITVATNMAGRGTDIKLGEGVENLGGLCVILTERHASRRVDRQLIGRCARQGDPGLSMEIIGLEDEVMVRNAPLWVKTLCNLMKQSMSSVPLLAGLFLVKATQRSAAAHSFRQRKQVMKNDDWRDEALGFTGREH